MKLLLDESLPRDLATCFPDTFEIKTVSGMGWSGSENGKLLTLAADAGFKALITVDKNIEYQQNLDRLPIAVIVLSAPRNTIHYLQPLIPQVVITLEDDPGRKLKKIQELRDTSVSNKERKP